MLTFVVVALLSFTPQTEQQMLSVEAGAIALDYLYKAPIDAELSLGDKLPVFASGKDVALPNYETALRTVNADDTAAQGAVPLPVKLANWQPTPNAVARATASVSPGLNIGRGVWSWRCTVCNTTDQAQAIDQGDIEYAANAVFIPSIGFGEAQTSNQLFINRSKPVVITKITQALTGGGTVLIASKVIKASGVWGAGFGVAMYLAGDAVGYFKSVTPADLATRFAGTTILRDGSSYTLSPRQQANHCATWEFFARYSGKNAVTRSGIPIY